MTPIFYDPTPSLITSTSSTSTKDTLAMATGNTPLPRSLSQQPLKRPAEPGDDPQENRPSKRQRQRQRQQNTQPSHRRTHKHYIHHKQSISPHSAIGEDEVKSMLSRSVGIALQATGFDAADPVALESLRAAAEECTFSYSRSAPVKVRLRG